VYQNPLVLTISNVETDYSQDNAAIQPLLEIW